MFADALMAAKTAPKTIDRIVITDFEDDELAGCSSSFEADLRLEESKVSLIVRLYTKIAWHRRFIKPPLPFLLTTQRVDSWVQSSRRFPDAGTYAGGRQCRNTGNTVTRGTI